jgi:AcrR family transcriptional regulator
LPDRNAPARPERRKRRSSVDLLNRIIQAAESEFRRCGYAGATTAAIARRAEVTEAQLFRYFDSKAALFRESVFKPLDQQLQAFLESHMADADPEVIRASMATYIDELQGFIEEHAELLTSLFVVQAYEPQTIAGLSTMSSLATYFQRGAAMSTARLTGPAKIDLRLMVRVSFAAVVGCVLFKDWIFPPGLATDEEIRAAVNGFVREGLAANPVMGPVAG